MSTIAVIGGTGYAGSAIVKEAAGRGHEVISVSRSLPAEPVSGVRYEQGQAIAATSVLDGVDVVVGALSPRGDNQGTLVDVYTLLAAAIADAGTRLVVIGGFGSLRPAPGAPRFAEGEGLPPEFAAEAGEMNSVRAALETTPETLDWVFVSPGAVFGAQAPGEARGTYRTGGDVALVDADGNSAISGPDFATAVVDEIETPTVHRAQISFAY
ncbi:NAD(P)-dependent oxidoreductase [Propionicicella superfundia]|uniref:NAD(P)-dependent oxidoreductase n=1 Tax=Propionicicella superfundia TaxID=348582 RepID=UPI0003F6ED88|nr:NAD(P)H-binding protein [Propionicicella superfundia]